VREVDVNGIRIAYERAGLGETLVLLHGFICDSRAWRPQIEELSSDFDVVAWDAPGCGKSSDPSEEFTMGEFADCLAALLDSLAVSAAHLLGLSWGGTLALEFHRRYTGRVRSLILADAYAGWTGSLGAGAAKQRLERCLRESQMPAAEWVPQWVPEAFSGGAPRELLDEYASIMSDFHPAGFRAMSRAVTPDFREALRAVSVPTLLIWGAEDSRSPVSCGEDMRQLIPGSRLAVIPQAGHVSNLEQPDRFNAVVREFIMGVGKE
jgi:pimeloyl-ACP methyl ester carboxylesterase